MAQSFTALDTVAREQMACTFSALLLHDEGIEVNAANLDKVLKASGNKVAAYWPMLFAQALTGKNVGDFCAVSGGSGAPAPVAQQSGDAPAEQKKEEAPVEEEEEDMDLGDLFG